MRISVVVPSEEFLSTAGARIRYQRIGRHLAELGHRLELQVIDAFKMRPKPAADVVLISKCYDARGLIVASEMHSRGIHVGTDIFDDYYSQPADSRFTHLRQWFRDISGFLGFALCSTPRLKDNLAQIAPQLPCHVMNDPYEEIDTAQMVERIESKLKRLRSTGILDIGWFGIGDNPHFPVGLSDLEAHAGMLAEFRRHGLEPRLSILTNRRALTTERLGLLARLPVPWRLEEWSEAAERRLIARSFLCFLPVNAQPFSIVKSLNRAVTALTGGAQVLSAGYPLYETFGDFIYRDVDTLAADVQASKPKLRRGTMPQFTAAMERHANPVRETAALARFLETLPQLTPAPSTRVLAVLHGRASVAAVHKFAQRSGCLSVAGFGPAAELNYDVKPCLHPLTGAAAVQLGAAGLKALRRDLARQVETVSDGPDGRQLHFLPMPEGFPVPAIVQSGGDARALAFYQQDIAQASRLLAELFPGLRIFVSDQGSPFWAGATVRDAA